MRELRRVTSGWSRLLVFLLIVLVNLGLYYRQQAADNYGFSDKVDGARALEYYNGLLDECRGLSAAEALEKADYYANMEERFDDIKSDLYQLDIYYRMKADGQIKYTDVWYLVYEQDLKDKQENFPELVEAISAGTVPDDETLAVQTAGAGRLVRQLEHIMSYAGYLEAVDANSRRMAEFSIFAKPGSFTAKNNVKTAGDFLAMQGTEPTLGRDMAVTSLFSYKLADWLLVLVMALTALSFLEERQRGLWATVHAAPGGRSRLALRRVTALALTAVIATAALYGSLLLAGFSLYGGQEGLGRAAQSVELFRPLTLRVSLGGLLARAALARALTAFVVGLLSWLLLAAANTSVRWMILGLASFLGAEYSLYVFLPDLSALQLFKYFNILSFIDLSPLYTRYFNLDLLGRPVNIRTVIAVSCVPLVLLLGGGCVLLDSRMRPRAARTPMARLGWLVNRGLDGLRARLGLTGFEAYKLLVTQGGLVILAAFVYLAVGSEYQVHISRWASDDLSLELQGEITDEIVAEMEARNRAIQEVYAISKDYQKAVEMGTMDFDTLLDFNLKYSGTQAEEVGLHTVMAKVDSLLEEQERLGVKLWLLDEVPFRNIYGSEADGVRLSRNLLTLLALSLLLAGFVSMERSSTGLRQLLHASLRGRGALARRKYALAAAATLLLWAVPTFYELKTLLSSIDRAVLSAPIQSLTFLGKFPWAIPIGAYLAILYLGRLIALLSCASVALWLSSLISKPHFAYLAVCAVLAGPTLLWRYLNIDLLRPLSAARVADLETLTAAHSGAPAAAFIAAGVLLLIGAVCIGLASRRWRKTA